MSKKKSNQPDLPDLFDDGKPFMYPPPLNAYSLWGETEVWIRCPACEKTSSLDDCDCMGADESCVFCAECGVELRYQKP